MPIEKSFLYEDLYKSKDLIDFTVLKNNLLEKINNDKKDYSQYVKNSFEKAYYSFEGTQKNTVKYKNGISVNYHCQSPYKINYTYGEKINIDIKVIVDSLNFYHIAPNDFAISDKNMQINFEYPGDEVIAATFVNKTKEYLSALSVTSYYKDQVFTHLDFNLELAPMSSKKYPVRQHLDFDFKNITREFAEKTFVDYGYALKYKIINTNIEKTIYDTKKYRLIDLLQSII